MDSLLKEKIDSFLTSGNLSSIASRSLKRKVKAVAASILSGGCWNRVLSVSFENVEKDLVFKMRMITTDLDSTVTPVYGNQEGADKGYNPKKRGLKSYYPLVTFVYEKGFLLNRILRRGGAENYIKDFKYGYGWGKTNDSFYEASTIAGGRCST